MKIAIVYYSYSGNTRRVAHLLKERLSAQGAAELIEIKDLSGLNNFFKQGKLAFKHERTLIEETRLDLSAFDMACFGTPVWAFTSAPPLNTYLDKCIGISGKPVILFTTSGGAGDARAIKYMQGILEPKGASGFKSFSIPQPKTKDKEFVISQINKALPLSPNG